MQRCGEGGGRVEGQKRNRERDGGEGEDGGGEKRESDEEVREEGEGRGRREKIKERERRIGGQGRRQAEDAVVRGLGGDRKHARAHTAPKRRSLCVSDGGLGGWADSGVRGLGSWGLGVGGWGLGVGGWGLGVGGLGGWGEDGLIIST
jgi:hypothetical protein